MNRSNDLDTVIKPKKTKNKQYFTKETEKAILLYNQLDDDQERNKLYSEKISHTYHRNSLSSSCKVLFVSQH